ncbi:VIT family protein [Paraglaciecola sp.]|nr:VIT family protein [Paraglaciecola sp.]MDB4281412.1 VIT family protein [Paraglaciecola sp.]MDB4327173.1 VIT family protein [bacterium]
MEYNHEHKSERISWIRAVVLGANDGIVSTASLIIAVTASQAAGDNIFTVGMAGLVAGAMSMAAGEYVSVSSQTDIEKAELALEESHIQKNWALEVQELANIYHERGVEPQLAKQVAEQLMEKDAIGSHARDELGITDLSQGNPLQAAVYSALSFSAGSSLPVLMILLVSQAALITAVIGISLFSLAVLGSISAHAGGASKTKGAIRVLFWGSLAMAVSMGVGSLFDASI